MTAAAAAVQQRHSSAYEDLDDAEEAAAGIDAHDEDDDDPIEHGWVERSPPPPSRAGPPSVDSPSSRPPRSPAVASASAAAAAAYSQRLEEARESLRRSEEGLMRGSRGSSVGDSSPEPSPHGSVLRQTGDPLGLSGRSGGSFRYAGVSSSDAAVAVGGSAAAAAGAGFFSTAPVDSAEARASLAGGRGQTAESLSRPLSKRGRRADEAASARHVPQLDLLRPSSAGGGGSGGGHGGLAGADARYGGGEGGDDAAAAAAELSASVGQLPASWRAMRLGDSSAASRHGLPGAAAGANAGQSDFGAPPESSSPRVLQSQAGTRGSFADWQVQADGSNEQSADTTADTGAARASHAQGFAGREGVDAGEEGAEDAAPAEPLSRSVWVRVSSSSLRLSSTAPLKSSALLRLSSTTGGGGGGFPGGLGTGPLVAHLEEVMEGTRLSQGEAGLGGTWGASSDEGSLTASAAWEREQRAEYGARAPAAAGDATSASEQQQRHDAGGESDDGEEIELLYDTLLGFYYDPKTNRYYELVDGAIVSPTTDGAAA